MVETGNRTIILAVGLVIFAMFLGVVLFQITSGYQIIDIFNTKVSDTSSRAGSDPIQKSHVMDGAQLYKVLDSNRNNIASFNITMKNGGYVRYVNRLLEIPSTKFYVKRVDTKPNEGIKLDIKEID